MNYSPAWEAGGWAGTLALLGVALAWAYLRIYASGKPPILRVLRVAVIGIVLFCLLKISIEHVAFKQTKPRLAIVVDTGLTMGAKDGTHRSRLQRAAAWLMKHRRGIESRAQPVLFAGSDRAHKIQWSDLESLPLSVAGFDFDATLQDVVSDGNFSRLWLLSDGITEEYATSRQAGPPPDWRAGTAQTRTTSRQQPFPIDAAGVGPQGVGRSVVMAEVKTPDFVFQHSRFNVGVSLEAGELAGGSVIVRLKKDSSVVAQHQLPIRDDYEVLNATFTAEAKSLGQERYRLEVEGPANCCKSQREFRVEVIRKKHRIMYLAGRPSAEYTELREQLKADPNHELVSFVILRNPENVSLFSDQELSLIPFPAQEIFVQNLFQFDIFILQNFAYWRFNLPIGYLEALKRFIVQGGALLVVGGSNAFTQGGYRGTPLEEVLPISLWSASDDYAPGTFRPRVLVPEHPMLHLADTPEQSAALWDSLSPLDGFNRFSEVKPGATVLLAHPTEKMPDGRPMPLMALREYGKGKIMVIGTDSTWRWKLGGGLQWRTSAFYGRFWSRAVQYLTGTLDLKRVKFSPLPDRMPPREPAVLTVRVFDESFRPLPNAQMELKVIWESPDGKSRAVPALEREPGIYEVSLIGLSEGPHHVTAIVRYRGQSWGEDRIRFFWEPKSPEMPLRRRWLKQVAENDSVPGRYADLARVPVSQWLETLPEMRPEREIIRRWHAWNFNGWLWILLGALILEWILRRRMGYV